MDQIDESVTTSLPPQYEIITNHPQHPFSSSSTQPTRIINFIIPHNTYPITATIIQYDNITHVMLTETGAFSTYLQATKLNNNDNNDNNTNANMIEISHLQGPSVYILELLCQKLSESIISIQVPIIYSLSLLNILQAKKVLKSKNDDDDDNFEISDEQMVIMKYIQSEFLKHVSSE